LLRIKVGSGCRTNENAAAIAEKKTRKATVIVIAICQSGLDASFRNIARL
jgi:hypothetical protein